MVWPSARNVAHEIRQQREGVVERRQLGDLAADVHVDADDAQARQLRGLRVNLARAADRNAELVLGAPVAILAWVLASTSGLTRTETFAVRPLLAAMAESSSSSGSDSTLTHRMFSSSASASSAAVLPMPENMILSGGTPAASARLSSPPDTTSAPAPSLASVAITAWLELALTE